MNETESIDNAIGQVERLYRSVTGQDAQSSRRCIFSILKSKISITEAINPGVSGNLILR